MRERRRLFLCFLLIKFFFFASTGQALSAQDILKPVKTTTPPAIDGKLDDPVWAEAPSVTGFKTFIPDFGLDISENTVAYMAYDSENLYFAFQCFDRQPEKIKASISRRDDIRPDDFVCINLDSFNDQQSLYAFYVNPLGIQMDSRYAGGKEDFSVDVVWSSAGKIHDRGYAVEIQIPLKSIRYSSGNRVEMGIFFERRISRRSEHGSYPSLDPKRGYFFLTQMAPIIPISARWRPTPVRWMSTFATTFFILRKGRFSWKGARISTSPGRQSRIISWPLSTPGISSTPRRGEAHRKNCQKR